MGRNHRELAEVDQFRIVELFDSGFKIDAIAKEVHRSPQTVRNVLDRLGIRKMQKGHTKPKHLPTFEEIELMKANIKAGWTEHDFIHRNANKSSGDAIPTVHDDRRRAGFTGAFT